MSKKTTRRLGGLGRFYATGIKSRLLPRERNPEVRRLKWVSKRGAGLGGGQSVQGYSYQWLKGSSAPNAAVEEALKMALTILEKDPKLTWYEHKNLRDSLIIKFQP